MGAHYQDSEHKSVNASTPVDVRFTPESGHGSARSGCPLCAKSGHNAVRQILAYSITSSAVTSSADGTVTPSVFAHLRLSASTNLVGCSTGRSAGFLPFRILST